MSAFITLLQSKELKNKLTNLNISIKEIDILIKDFEVNYKEIHQENIDSIDSIVEAIYLSYKSGLSIRKDLGYAHLQLTKEKKDDKYIRVIKFMPMYKGLLYKVREAGFDIDCDYILHCEQDGFYCDFNANTIKINTNKRFLLPVPVVPKLPYLQQDLLIKQLENYEWKNYNIIGFYAIVKNTTTNQNVKIARYNLAEIIERCVVVERDFTTKKDIKKIKNKFLSDYLNSKEMMLTNVIEALKIRVIRLICKTLNEDLAKITTLIDKTDGYIDVIDANDIVDNIDNAKLTIDFEQIKKEIENTNNETQLNIINKKIAQNINIFSEEQLSILRITFQTKKNELQKV
jgi:hypothetical protein